MKVTREYLRAVVYIIGILIFLIFTIIARAQSLPAIDRDKDNDGLIEISTLEQLNAMRYDLDGDGHSTENEYTGILGSFFINSGCPSKCTGYELTADLDFDTNGDGSVDSSDDYYNSGSGWEPIGDGTNAFNTNFHGNGHTISNLTIDRGTEHWGGLFGELGSSAVVRNLGLDSVSVSAKGAFQINPGEHGVGALAGVSRGLIYHTYSTGSVTGVGAQRHTGGLVGINIGDVFASYSSAQVTGDYDIGGLVGYNDGSILWTYATGNVSTGGFDGGGLVGDQSSDATIAYSYSSGEVTENFDANAGGLISGSDDGTITQSYFDSTRSNRPSSDSYSQTSSNLQTPVSASGIFSDWDKSETVIYEGELSSGNDGARTYGYRKDTFGSLSPTAIGLRTINELSYLDSGFSRIAIKIVENGRKVEVPDVLSGSVITLVQGTTTITSPITSFRVSPLLDTFASNLLGTDVARIFKGSSSFTIRFGIPIAGIKHKVNISNVWDFGSSIDMPLLSVDFNGDGSASVGEFGDQFGKPVDLGDSVGVVEYEGILSPGYNPVANSSHLYGYRSLGSINFGELSNKMFGTNSIKAFYYALGRDISGSLFVRFEDVAGDKVDAESVLADTRVVFKRGSALFHSLITNYNDVTSVDNITLSIQRRDIESMFKSAHPFTLQFLSPPPPRLSDPSSIGATNDNTPDLSFTTNEAGDITLTGGCASSTTTATAGVNTITFNMLSDGSYDCSLTVTNTQGIVSEPLVVPTFVVDTVVPIITIEGSAEIVIRSGTYVDPGATVTDPGNPDYTGTIRSTVNGPSGQNSTISGSNARIMTDETSLGLWTIRYTASADRAGNTPRSVTRRINVVSSPILSSPSSVGITNDATPDFSFTTDEAGTITLTGGCVSSATTATTGVNTITFNTLSDGTYSCTITVTDSDSEVSFPLTIPTFTIDTIAPSAPSLPDLSSVDDTGASNEDNITKQTNNLTFIVAGENGSEVYLYNNNTAITGATGTVIVGSASVGTDLQEGTHIITAKQIDEANNESPMSNQLTVIVDTTSPTLSGLSNIGSTKYATPDLSFTSSEAGTINLTGGCASSTTTATAGVNTITFNTLTDGTYDCTITLTDTAGNVSAEQTISTFTIDTTPPVITINGNTHINVDRAEEEYTDAGAEVTDAGNTNYTGVVSTTIEGPNGETVFRNTTLGIWTFTYSAPSDASGNVPASVTRTVKVNVPLTLSDFPVIDGETVVRMLVQFTSDGSDDFIIYDTTTIPPTGVLLDSSDSVINDNLHLSKIHYNKSTRILTLGRTGSQSFSSWANNEGQDMGIYMSYRENEVRGLQIMDASRSSNLLTFFVQSNTPMERFLRERSSDTSQQRLFFSIGTLLDDVAPVLSNPSDIGTTNDNTPDFSFTSNEDGTFTLSGSCSSNTEATVTANIEKTITLKALQDGEYTDCSVMVTDSLWNTSRPLAIPTFRIDTVAPVIEIIGDANVIVIGGNDYADAGATVTDQGNPDYVGSVTVIISGTTGQGSFDTTVLGMWIFTYSAPPDDAGNTPEPVTRTITVMSPARDDSATVNEDTEIVIDVLANDIELSGGVLTIATAPTNGVATVSSNTEISYTPNANYNGDDSFAYSYTIGENTYTATVTITITSINDAPVLIGAPSTSYTLNTSLDIDLSTHFTDADGDTLVFSVTSSDDAIALASISENTLTVTPRSDGTATLTVTVGDGTTTITQTYSITINLPITVSSELTPEGASRTKTLTLTTLQSPTITYKRFESDATDTCDETGYDDNTDTEKTYSTALSFVSEDDNGDIICFKLTQASKDTVYHSVLISSIDTIAPVITVREETKTEFTTRQIYRQPPAQVIDPGNSDYSELVWAVVTNEEGIVIPITDITKSIGVYTITYSANADSAGNSPENVVRTITVVSPARDDSVTVNEDAEIVIDVLANDIELSGGTLSIETQPSNGVATVSSNTEISYTPNTNYNGDDSLTYKYDIEEDSYTANVILTITPTNDAPTLSPATTSYTLNAALDIDISTHFTDIDGDALTFSVTSSDDSKATGTISGSTLTITPLLDGDITLTVLASDGTETIQRDYSITIDLPLTVSSDLIPAGRSQTKTLTLTFSHAPTITYKVIEQGSTTTCDETGYNANTDTEKTYTTALSFVSEDDNGDSICFKLTQTGKDTIYHNTLISSIDTTPPVITVSTEATTEFIARQGYTPPASSVADPGNSDYNEDVVISITNSAGTTIPIEDVTNALGVYTITYSASADSAGNTPASITRTITVVSPTRDDSATVNEDTAVIIDVIANDVGLSGGTLSVSTNPSNGVATVSSDTEISYTPNENFNGSDSFVYTYTIGENAYTGTVNITITSINDAPVANDESITINEDSSAYTITPTITDSDGETPAITSITTPSKGSATFTDTTTSYTPTTDENGADSFDYTVTDGAGATDTGTIAITITPINDAPTLLAAATTSYTLSSAQEIDLSTHFTDIDGDTLVFSVTSSDDSIATGTISGSTLTVTPLLDGSATLTLTVNDGTTTITQTYSITIDLPLTVSSDLIPTGRSQTKTLTLTTSHAPTITYKVIDQGSTTTCDETGYNANSDTEKTYTTALSFEHEDDNGDSVCFKLTQTDKDTVYHNALISGIDTTAPVITVSPETKTEFTTRQEYTLPTATATDIGNSDYNEVVSVVITNSAGITIPVEDVTDAVGTYTITYSAVADSSGNVPENVVREITVISPARDDSVTVNEDTEIVIDVLANDIELSGGTLAVSTAPSNGVATASSNTEISYTPNENYNGSDSFVYSYTIGEDVYSANVILTITPINDAPKLLAAAITSYTLSSALDIDISTHFTDIDGDALTFSVTSSDATIATGTISGSTLTITPLSDGTATLTLTVGDGTTTITQEYSITVDLPLTVSSDLTPTGRSQTKTLTLTFSHAPTITYKRFESDATDTCDSSGYSTNTDTEKTYTITPLQFTSEDDNGDSVCFKLTQTDKDTVYHNALISGIDTTAPVITVAEETKTEFTTTQEYTPPPAQVIDPGNSDYSEFVWTLVTNEEGITIPITDITKNIGVYTITYSANADSAGNTPENVVRTITVVSPVVDDNVETNEDTEIVIDVLANDVGLTGGTLAVSTNPSNGVATASSDTEITYTPNENYNGDDSFMYSYTIFHRVWNPHTGRYDIVEESYTETVSITINPINDAPVTHDESITINEDSSAYTITPTITDIDGETPAITEITAPSKGSATFTATAISYTPNKDENGADSFDYTVTDGAGETDTGTITITITPINDAPTLIGVPSTSYTLALPKDIDLSTHFTDIDGDTLVFSVTSSDESIATGTISGSTLTITPLLDGSATLTVTVDDGTTTITQEYSITVFLQIIVSSEVLPTGRSQTKTLTLTFTLTPTVTYKLIESDITYTCDASGYNANTDTAKTYTTPLQFTSEDDNGDTVCFKLTQATKDTVYYSQTINNIDTTKPVITVPTESNTEVTARQAYTLPTATVTDIGNPGYNESVVINITDSSGTSVSMEDLIKTVGVYTVTYSASADSSGNTPENVVRTITVVSPAVDDNVETDEDTQIVIDVLANDIGLSAGTLAVETPPSNGVATVSSNTEITYTPNTNFNGSDSFVYSYTIEEDSYTGNVILTITSVNDVPVAQDESITIDEDSSAYTITPTITDSDGETPAITSITTPSKGSATFTATTITYTPNANENGQDTFTYTATDLLGATATGTITITITPISDAPILSSTATTTHTITTITEINLSTHFTDADGDTLTFSVTNSDSTKATATISGSTLTITPLLDGSATLTLTASDGTTTITQTYSITVNLPIIVSSDLTPTGRSQTKTLTLTATQSPTITYKRFESDATDTCDASGYDTNTGAEETYITTTPLQFTSEDDNGDIICFKLTQALKDTVYYPQTINNIDTTAPVIIVSEEDVTEFTTRQEYTPPATLVIDAGNTDYNEAVEISITNSSGTIVPQDDVTDVIGTYTVTYTAPKDSAGNTPEPVTREITVISPSKDDGALTDEDTEIVIDVLANDIELSGGTLSVETQPTNGVAVASSNTEITYTPNENYNGSDSFVYLYTIGENSYTATVIVIIAPINDIPVANDESITINEDSSAYTITPTITDSDGETPSITEITAPSKGSATFTATEISYIPNTNENGTDSFTYTVTDGAGETDTGTITITITPVNDAPRLSGKVITNYTITTVQEIDVSSHFTDVEGDTLTFSTASADDTKALASISGTIITITPLSDGTTTLTVTVDDGTDTITQEYSITIDLPLTVSSEVTPEGRSQTKTLTLTFSHTPTITYKIIESDATDTCDASGYNANTDTEKTYTTTPLSFEHEDDNGDSVCFKLTQTGKYTIYHIQTINDIDTTAPVITPIRETNIELTTEEEYTEEGALVTDNDLSYNEDAIITITDEDGVEVQADVLTDNLGVYTVTYTASADSAGNTPEPVIRTITVVDPFNLDFDGNNIFIPSQDALALYLVTQLGVGANTLSSYVYDRSVVTSSNAITLINKLESDTTSTPLDFDGNNIFIPSQDALALYLVTQLGVGANTLASYVYDRSVVTSSKAITLINELVFKTNRGRDIIAPVIRLNGAQSIELTTEEEYTEEGAEVSDNDISYNEDVIITITNSNGDTVAPEDVTDTIGTYTATYSAPADSAGNTPEPITREITVVDAFNLDFDGNGTFAPSQDALALYLVTQLSANANTLSSYVHDGATETASNTITLISNLVADTTNTPLDFDGNNVFTPSQDALSLYLVTQLSANANTLSSYVYDGSPATAGNTITLINNLVEKTNR